MSLSAAEDVALRRRIREARVTAARGNKHWREVSRDGLTRRPFGLFVDETGRQFKLFRGSVFDRGTIEFHEQVDMAFFVDAGDVVMLEPVP